MESDVESPNGRRNTRVGSRKNLSAERVRHGMTQVMLADQLDVNPSTVVFWESGRTTPSKKNLDALCSILDCSAPYLLKRFGVDDA